MSTSSLRERGHMYFAYRPKIDAAAAHGLDDVQRLYVILSPRGRDSDRLLIVGDKRLPAVSGGRDRTSWAFVEKVSSRPEDVERHLPAARPCGEAVYAIVRHNNHTHLAYVLELPAEPGEVQRALNIVPEGSYIVAVKNPRAPSAPGIGLDEERRARLPRPLQSKFRGRRFVPLDPPDFLDHEGTELLLVGARQNVTAELGVRLDAERETETTADIFTDLRLEKTLHPVTPLLEGKWA